MPSPHRKLVNERGHLVGEDHPAARLNWHDVELMRQLHDEGLSMMEIARKFEMPWSTVRDVCRYLTWTDQPVRVAVHASRAARREQRAALRLVSAGGAASATPSPAPGGCAPLPQ